LLARHAEEAGDVEKAIGYWEAAGAAAVGRPAYREAIGHFENALRLIDGSAGGVAGLERSLRLLVNLGQAQMAAVGYGADETIATYARAVRLADDPAAGLGNSPLRFAAMYGAWAADYIRAIEDSAVPERMLAQAEAAGDQGARLVALRCVALARFHAGRFAEALALVDEVLAHYDPALHGGLALRFSLDAKVGAMIYRSWALWHLGRFDGAIETMDAMLAWATQRNHANTTGFALGWGSVITNVFMRRVPELVAASRHALATCAEIATPMWYNFARVFMGWGLAHQGAYDEGLAEMNAAIERLRASGTGRWTALIHGLKAEACALARRPGESDAALSEAFELLDSTQDLAVAGYLHCLAGQARLMDDRNDSSIATESFERALSVARSQGSKAIELRAATSLARLWAERGEQARAHDLLAPVYGWFTEGFGTRDLIEAKALLDSLA
jgi:tetratricopeptide (TPR) repeat protein